MMQEFTILGYNGRQLKAWCHIGKTDSKPPLILVHGLGTDSSEFAHFPDVLVQQGFSVLTFDLGGHGQSGGIRGLLQQESICYDLKAIVDFFVDQTKRSVCLLGHSFGAHVVLQVASDFENVEGVILLAPQLRSGDSLSWGKKLLFKLIGAAYRYLPFLPDVYARPQGTRNSLDYGRAQPGRRPALVNLRSLQYATQADNRPLVRSLKLPKLFLACEEDKDIPVESVRKLFEIAHGERKKLIVVPGAPHSPFFAKEYCRGLAKSIKAYYIDFFRLSDLP